MTATQHEQVKTARFDGSGGPRIIGPRDGKSVDLRSLGVRFMIWGEESGGSVSLVEHPIPPRTLVAPLHRHSLEDEYSYVLEGRMGAQLGDDVVIAEPGDLVFKPRHQWHTFWNAGDGPCRILEIISPAGFEHFFEEVGEKMARHIQARCSPVRTSPYATPSTSSRRQLRASARSTASCTRAPEEEPERQMLGALLVGCHIREPRFDCHGPGSPDGQP